MLDGRHLLAWIKLGEIHLSLNDRAQASEAFRRALTLDARSVAAYRGLCQSDEVTPDSDVAAKMRTLLTVSGIRPREVAELHYTLAQIYRRAGRGEEFVRHLLAANAEQRKLCSEGRAEYQAVFDRLESAFTREAFAKAPRLGAVTPAPLFVLGMPRSGTTLAEQLLAAHPEVAAGGEVEYVRRLVQRAFAQQVDRRFPEGFESMGAANMSAIAQTYVRRMAIIGGNARFVTDKTPGNFHLLGLLRVLFPNGKIVHMKRDPMDTCFSILQYPFDDRSPHTCDMRLLAYVYGRYARLMDRWRDLMGDEFITVEYERLVRSPAEEARHLYEHCGLGWRDEYLEFHRANSAVRTFSVSQVRQPVYTSSIGAWLEYADALAPLKEALDMELAAC